MNQEEHFDDIVKRKLNEREFSPGDESWNKALALIEADQSGNISRIIKRSALLLLFIIASVGSGMYFLSGNGEKNTSDNSSSGPLLAQHNSSSDNSTNNNLNSGTNKSGSGNNYSNGSGVTDQTSGSNNASSAISTNANGNNSVSNSDNNRNSVPNSNSSSTSGATNHSSTAPKNNGSSVSGSSNSNNATSSSHHSSTTAHSTTVTSYSNNSHATSHTTSGHNNNAYDATHTTDVNMQNVAAADPNITTMQHVDAADPNINNNMQHVDAADPNINNNMQHVDAADPNVNNAMQNVASNNVAADTGMHVMRGNDPQLDSNMQHIVQKNLDADSAANAQSSSSSSTSRNGNVNFPFAEIGITFIPGTHYTPYAQGEKWPGNSVNLVLGIGYEFHLKNNFSLQSGLRYTYVNNISDSTKSYYGVQYSFGSTASMMEISMKRLHYFEVPVNLYMHFGRRSSVFGGMSFNYLFATECHRTITEYNGGLARQAQSGNIFGYGNQLNRFDAEVQAGYGLLLGEHVHATISAFYGLGKLRNTDLYGIDLFSRNKGFMFTLQYSF